MQDKNKTKGQLIQEITDLRQRVTQLESLEKERVRVEEALRQQTEELEALQATVLDITLLHDLPTLLDTIVQRAIRLLDAPIGGLYLCNPDRKQVWCVVSYNTPEDYCGTVLEYGEGAAGIVAQTAKPLNIDDYSTWEGRATAFEQEQPFRAVLAVPMTWQGEVTGVIDVVHYAEDRSFTTNDLNLLTLFANHAAIAVENTRLFEQAKEEIRQRKRLEKQIEERRLYLESVLACAPDAIVTLNAQHRVMEWNQGAEKLFGYSSEEAIGQDLDHLIAGGNTQHLEEAIGFTRQALAGEIVPPTETVRYRQDGRPIDVLLSGSPIVIDGQLVGTVAVYTDITERKQAAEALRDAKQEKETILDSLVEHVVHQDTEMRILWANHAACESVNMTRQELIGRFCHEVWAERQDPCPDCPVMQAMRSGQPHEVEKTTPDGRGWFIRGYPVRDEGGNIIGGVEITLEITELERAEQALREREELFRLLFEQAPIGMAITDLDGQYLRANQALCATLGYTEHELLSHTFMDLTPPEDVPANLVLREKALQGEIPYFQMEKRFITKTGTTIHVLLQAALVRDAKGQPLHFIGQIVNITERKQTEEELWRRTEQLEALRQVGLELGAQLDLETLLHSIVSRAVELLECTSGGLYLYQPDLDALEWVMSVGSSQVPVGSIIHKGEGLSGKIWQTGEPLIVDDYQNWEGQAAIYADYFWKAVVGVPIRWRDKFLGVIVVESELTAAFTLADAELLSLFASQAAIAIENARLFEAEREQRNLAEALRQASAAVSSTLDLDQVLDLILEQLSRVLPNDASNIMLIENGRTYMVRWRGYEQFGVEEAIQKVTFSVPEAPVLRQIHETGELVIVPDTAAYEGWIDRPETRWLRSLASAPIRVQDEVIGFLNVDSATPGFFHQDHADSLRAFANQASLALSNAQLFYTVEQGKREWEATFDAMQDAVVLVDQDRCIVRANQAFAEIVNRELPTLIGQTYDTTMDGMTCPEAICHLEETTGAEQAATCVHEYQGQTFEVQATPIIERHLEEPGTAPRTIYVMRNITERRNAEEIQRRLSAAVEQAAEAVVISDTKGNIIYVNPAFGRITGHSQTQPIGQILSFFEYEDQEVTLHHEAWQRLQAGRTWRGQFEGRTPDGEPYTLDSIVTPVRNQAGEIVNFVATLRDVTREVQLEEQFRQAQKMEALGRLAGGVAHDFNNLLTVIHLSTRLIQRQMHPQDPLSEHIARIQEASDRAAKLTKQLLSFSRREAIEPQVLNLSKVVGDLSRMLQRIIGEDIELVTDLAGDLWPVRADPSQMEQVVLNLAVNARDAMPEGGRLTIKTANIILNEAYVAEHVDAQIGEHTMLIVSDTGQGMSEEVMSHLFEPFFTTKERGQGTGLGLPTVFGVVKQHEGHIWVESQPGQGTTFELYLPCTREAKAQPTSRPHSTTASHLVLGTETVLIVEDEEAVRRLAVTVLKSCGYQVLEAGNGPEALTFCEQYKGPIHLLLTDVVMPQMGGRELAEQLQFQRPEMRVIYMSGYTDDAIVRRGVLTLGTLLSKPFTIEELTQKVRAVLDSQG
jgi:PAS domain S-box-containing protein